MGQHLGFPTQVFFMFLSFASEFPDAQLEVETQWEIY
jgi:hypothetical protein